MRILVTGGCGFIGTNLCRLLIKQGHHVICLDNCSSGKKDNIKSLLSHPHFVFVEGDVMDTTLGMVDQIYHLACPASPKNYQKDPIATAKTNFIGTLNMLNLAKSTNARILLSSTSEIYGDPQVSPQSESYWGNVNSIGIRSCYDEGKRIAETLMMDYNRMFGIDVRIARIFNTYGPFLAHNDGRVVSNFIIQALSGEDITIYGDGQQTRSFCYVDDLLSGLVKLMNSDHVGPVNLGNPNELTILDLSNKIIELTESKSRIIFCPLPEDDPKVRKPDITKAKGLLEWFPDISLETGLKLTIQYFKNGA